jgi:hypothetical protein
VVPEQEWPESRDEEEIDEVRRQFLGPGSQFRGETHDGVWVFSRTAAVEDIQAAGVVPLMGRLNTAMTRMGRVFFKPRSRHQYCGCRIDRYVGDLQQTFLSSASPGQTLASFRRRACRYVKIGQECFEGVRFRLGESDIIRRGRSQSQLQSHLEDSESIYYCSRQGRASITNYSSGYYWIFTIPLRKDFVLSMA